MLDFALLAIAAFGAGVLNAVAGGGTFLTFPALVAVGIPPVTANATSTLAVFPGYMGAAAGYGEELRVFSKAQLVRIFGIALVGGAIGSLLLLVTPNTTFSAIVPFLLLIATLVFLFGNKVRDWAATNARNVTPFGIGGLMVVSIYGGYFNGGLGIILLALFALWGMNQIHIMNGLKSALSVVLSAISVAIFAVAGIIAWPQALVMMVASTLGGYLGAPLARKLPSSVVRGIVATVGFGMSAIFFVRLFLD